MTVIEQAKALKDRISRVMGSAVYTVNEDILEMPPGFIPDWTPGQLYKANNLCMHNGIKYLIIQPVTAQAHQPPDMPNGVMLSIYKPYRDNKRYPWMYGEYCERGFERSDAGYWWRLTAADAGANIFQPSYVTAIWERLEAVE